MWNYYDWIKKPNRKLYYLPTTSPDRCGFLVENNQPLYFKSFGCAKIKDGLRVVEYIRYRLRIDKLREESRLEKEELKNKKDNSIEKMQKVMGRPIGSKTKNKYGEIKEKYLDTYPIIPNAVIEGPKPNEKFEPLMATKNLTVDGTKNIHILINLLIRNTNLEAHKEYLEIDPLSEYGLDPKPIKEKESEDSSKSTRDPRELVTMDYLEQSELTGSDIGIPSCIHKELPQDIQYQLLYDAACSLVTLVAKLYPTLPDVNVISTKQGSQKGNRHFRIILWRSMATHLRYYFRKYRVNITWDAFKYIADFHPRAELRTRITHSDISNYVPEILASECTILDCSNSRSYGLRDAEFTNDLEKAMKNYITWLKTKVPITCPSELYKNESLRHYLYNDLPEHLKVYRSRKDICDDIRMNIHCDKLSGPVSEKVRKQLLEDVQRYRFPGTSEKDLYALATFCNVNIYAKWYELDLKKFDRDKKFRDKFYREAKIREDGYDRKVVTQKKIDKQLETMYVQDELRSPYRNRVDLLKRDPDLPYDLFVKGMEAQDRVHKIPIGTNIDYFFNNRNRQDQDNILKQFYEYLAKNPVNPFSEY